MRKRIHYTGRVQGVGFRATAQSCARRFPVTGWVRNQLDGSVLIELQGSSDAVESVLVAISGVFARHISAHDEAEVPDVPGETGFEIRRG